MSILKLVCALVIIFFHLSYLTSTLQRENDGSISTYQALYYSPYIDLHLRLGKMYLHFLFFNSRENNTRSIIFLKVIEIPNVGFKMHAFSSWPCSTVYAHKSFPLKALPGDTMLSYFVPCSFPQRARTYFLYFVKSTILIAR